MPATLDQASAHAGDSISGTCSFTVGEATLDPQDGQTLFGLTNIQSDGVTWIATVQAGTQAGTYNVRVDATGGGSSTLIGALTVLPIATINGGNGQTFALHGVIGGTYDIDAWAGGQDRPLALLIAGTTEADGFESGNFGGTGFWYATMPTNVLLLGVQSLLLRNEDTDISQDLGTATIVAAIVAGPAIAAGWYADQTDLEAALSVQNVKITADQENATAPGSPFSAAMIARMQLAFNLADALIDARLDALGYVVPVVKPMSTRDAAILKDIAVWLVEWQLKQWRIIQSTNPKAAAALDKRIGEMKQMALSTLDRIGLGFIKLTVSPTADNAPVAINASGAVSTSGGTNPTVSGEWSGWENAPWWW